MCQQRMIGNRHQPLVIDQRAHCGTGFFWGQSRIQRLRLVGHDSVRQHTALDRADREGPYRLAHGAAPIVTLPALCATIPPGWSLPQRRPRCDPRRPDPDTTTYRRRMTMPVYAVTGTSGHLGRFAIEQLLARGVTRLTSSPWCATRARPQAWPGAACRCAKRTIP